MGQREDETFIEWVQRQNTETLAKGIRPTEYIPIAGTDMTGVEKEALLDIANEARDGLNARQRAVFDQFFVPAEQFNRTRTTTGAVRLTTEGEDFDSFSGVDQQAARRITDPVTGEVTYQMPEGAKMTGGGTLQQVDAIGEAIFKMNLRLDKAMMQLTQQEKLGRRPQVASAAKKLQPNTATGPAQKVTATGRFTQEPRSNSLTIRGGVQ